MKRIYQKGFTLIELLIVLAIMGVMAAAVLLAIDPAAKIKSAKDATVKSDMGQLVNALQAYYTGGSQTYPASGNGVAVGLGALIPGEVKALPSQQSGATLPCATGGNTSYANSYCYLATTTLAAIWGNIFTTAGSYWCWDSTNVAFKVSASAPSAPNYTCP